MFNIFLADLCFILNNTEIPSYAEDTTPHAVSDNTDDSIASLEKSSKDLLKWFNDNLMKSDADKCHLLCTKSEVWLPYNLDSSCRKTKMEIAAIEIENSAREKLLGVHFNNKLTFDYQVSELHKKLVKKLKH